MLKCKSVFHNSHILWTVLNVFTLIVSSEFQGYMQFYYDHKRK